MNGSGGCKIFHLLSSLVLLSCRLICCVTVWVILMYSQGAIFANPLFGLELGFVVIFGSTALSGMVDIGQDYIFSQKVKSHSCGDSFYPSPQKNQKNNFFKLSLFWLKNHTLLMFSDIVILSSFQQTCQFIPFFSEHLPAETNESFQRNNLWCTRSLLELGLLSKIFAGQNYFDSHPNIQADNIHKICKIFIMIETATHRISVWK